LLRERVSKLVAQRPKVYDYYENLIEVVGDESVFFNGEFVWPRQLELHLPGNHKTHCNLNCTHCQGHFFKKGLDHWELTALDLLHNLKGAIPYHIYGGAYTEPLLNSYYMTFLATTKKYDNHFGIHTNGTLLSQLEEQQGWLTELNRIATDRIDYLSVSLDGAYRSSWAKVKNTKEAYLFDKIIDGVKQACEIRRKNKAEGHAIRLCYLITDINGSPAELDRAVEIARETGVDSLRFSIPYDNYTKKFKKLEKYKEEVEKPAHEKYKRLLNKYLSKNKDDKPYIFYVNPNTTCVTNYYFKKCIYSYFQITYGADGYAYKCSAVAAPNAKHCRLGKITSDIDLFTKMILANYNKEWDCEKMCFKKGLRCNRQAIEINQKFYQKNGRNCV